MTSSSSSSGDLVAEEKQGAPTTHGTPSPRASNHDLAKTEANIMPDTADETADLDVEKAKDQMEIAAESPAGGPGAFPEGGLKAWLTVSGAFCCLFCSFGWINCEIHYFFLKPIIR